MSPWYTEKPGLMIRFSASYAVFFAGMLHITALAIAGVSLGVRSDEVDDLLGSLELLNNVTIARLPCLGARDRAVPHAV
jgi:hypothetical protein